MSSYEADATYRLLLKRYEEKGFLKPEMALEANIRDLVQKGRTREEAIRELSSSDSPWTYSPDETIYEKLLKMYYKEYRNSETMLNYHIAQLTDEGKTREEAILHLYNQKARDKTVEQATESKEAVLKQIASLREKIDSLTSLYSKGEITEETYLRGVKKIEDDIGRLQQEHGIPDQKRVSRSISETAIQESIERDLLYSRAPGKPSVILTNKRLIAGEREIYLQDISEAYAKQGYLESKLVIRLKSGTEEEFEIAAESLGSSGRVGSFLAVLSGDIAAMEGDIRAHSKATIDRWVNRINGLLT